MLTPSSNIGLLESCVDQRKRLHDGLQDSTRHIYCLKSIEDLKQSKMVFDALVIDLDFDSGRGEALISELCQGTELTSILISARESQLHQALHCLELGAMSVLEKPFDLQRSKVVVDQAILGTRLRRKTRRERQVLGERIALLTDRQREVFRLMVSGKHVKEIALEMGIGIKTVHTFRTQLFDKLDIDSPLQLIRDVAMVFGRRGLAMLSTSVDDQTIALLVQQVRQPKFVDIPA
ncbi:MULTISPECIES: LuxR C-terminal-related transcriptional regulator [Pirellulaceae]|uniref:LuxR C-terminal-related transcriptional regulator n=1 Tax=Pirellulaceae TaxID=2691357 RepID=UPI000CFA568C|nr:MULTISPECIES: LuxR C-terminal-related transcriptional regulator [Pirellulaceae]